MPRMRDHKLHCEFKSLKVPQMSVAEDGSQNIKLCTKTSSTTSEKRNFSFTSVIGQKEAVLDTATEFEQ